MSSPNPNEVGTRDPRPTVGEAAQPAAQQRSIHERDLSRQELGALSELAPVGIYRTGPVGTLTFVNRRWCELTGVAARDALGGPWDVGIPPGHTEHIQRAWWVVNTFTDVSEWERLDRMKSESAGAGRPARPTTEHRQRVLIVEDDADLCDVLTQLLAEHRIDVDTAAGLVGARDALAASLPDLVLLDVGLPDGNGLSLLDDLRGRLDRPPPPVVVHSVDESVQDAVEAEVGHTRPLLVEFHRKGKLPPDQFARRVIELLGSDRPA